MNARTAVVCWIVSGHTLEHVAAGLAGLPVVWMLWHRELVAGAASAPERANRAVHRPA